MDQSLLLSQLCNVVCTSVNFDRPSKKIVTPVHHVALGREVAEGVECCIFKGRSKKKKTGHVFAFKITSQSLQRVCVGWGGPLFEKLQTFYSSQNVHMFDHQIQINKPLLERLTAYL